MPTQFGTNQEALLQLHSDIASNSGSKGNHPKRTCCQAAELLKFTKLFTLICLLVKRQSVAGPGNRTVDNSRLYHVYFRNCTVTTFKYVESGPGHKVPEIVWNFSSIHIFIDVCLNQLDSVCLNGLAGQGKPSRRYSKIPVCAWSKQDCFRCFRCSCRIHMLVYVCM